MVLFLHGAGERGCDGHAHLRDAGRFARLAPEPCFVLAPQCPLRRRWVEVHWGNDHHTMPTKPGAALELAVNHLDELLKQEPEADRQRVYLVGLSMGGFGVWDALTRWPGRFAGALAICGGADDGALEVAGPPALPPVWAFHGAADSTVHPHRSKGAYEALRRNHRAAGIPEAASRYTVYDGVGHACWDQAFQAAAGWLFTCRRPSFSEPAVAEFPAEVAEGV